MRIRIFDHTYTDWSQWSHSSPLACFSWNCMLAELLSLHYTKTSRYTLWQNGNDVFLRIITYARVHITRVYAIISYMSAYLSVYRALPRTEWIFLFFEGSFLAAPRAVLFHATAIHCHYGKDIEDALFFVLECHQFKSSIQLEKIEKWTSELNYITKKVLKTKSW